MLQAARITAGGRLFRLLIGALILVSAAAQFALVPLGAGVAAAHLGAAAAFGLTDAVCAAALAVTAALTWRGRRPARAVPGSSPTPRPGRTRSPSARPS